MTTTWGGGDRTGESRCGEEAAGRCLIWRKCATCGEQTDHAYLRDGDKNPDYAEKRDTHVAVREAIAELIATLETCEVKVKWRPDEKSWKPKQVAMLLEWLNGNTFELRLNGNEQPILILAALEAAWLELVLYDRDRGGSWRSVSAEDPDDTDYPPYRYRMLTTYTLERAEWESS